MRRELIILFGPLADQIIKGYNIDCSRSSQTGFTQAHGLLYLGGWVVLPDAYGLRQMVFQALHATPYAGHKGVHATSRLIKPNMDVDIKCWI